MGSSEPDVPPSAEERLGQLFEDWLAMFSPEDQERMVNAALAVKVRRAPPEPPVPVPLPQTQEAERHEFRAFRFISDPAKKLEPNCEVCGKPRTAHVTPPSVPSEEPGRRGSGGLAPSPNDNPCSVCGAPATWHAPGDVCHPKASSPPDEPLDAETEKKRRIEEAVAHACTACWTGKDSAQTESEVREILTALVRDARRPVEQARDALRESLVGAHERWAEARQALEAAERERNSLHAAVSIASPKHLLDEVATLRRAARTRPDYDCRCQDCGAAHNLDTSIPSATWNAICENRPGITPGAAGIGMPEVGMLCTLCIDERLGKAGIQCHEAEFYFVGMNLRGKLYTESQGDVERLEREVADLEQRGAGLAEAGRDYVDGKEGTGIPFRAALAGWAKRGTPA